MTYRILFGFRERESRAETMTAAWKLKRPLSYALLAGAFFCLYAYTRAQIRLSDLMVSEQDAFERAWREGYRLSPQDFRVRVQADTFPALSRLTNSPPRGSPWPLPETIWWLRSTFVDPGARPQDPPVQWSDIEEFLNREGVFNSQEALDVLMTLRSFQFPVASRRLGYLAPLTRLEGRLLLELGLLLHQDRREEAWSHVLGLTRLATRYKPDPVTTAQVVRSQFMEAALTAYWSFSRRFALSHADLEAILESWREADVLGGMPDMVAYTRCEFLPGLNDERLPRGFARTWQAFQLLQRSPNGFGEQWDYFKYSAISDVKFWFDDHWVLYLDSLNLIQTSCRRERALRRMIQLESWPEMRRVLETIQDAWPPFSNPSRAETIYSLRHSLNQIWMRALPSDMPDYDCVPFVEAESLRRLAVAGLMLQIQVAQTGSSPADAHSIPTLPKDFRTGAPFVYQQVGLRDFELRSPVATNASTPVFDPEKIYPRIPRKTPVVWPSQRGSP